MTPTPEEIETLRRAEEDAGKQQAPVDAGVDLDAFAALGDVVSAVGTVAEGAVELVGGVLGGIASVFEGL